MKLLPYSQHELLILYQLLLFFHSLKLFWSMQVLWKYLGGLTSVTALVFILIAISNYSNHWIIFCCVHLISKFMIKVNILSQLPPFQNGCHADKGQYLTHMYRFCIPHIPLNTGHLCIKSTFQLFFVGIFSYFRLV